MSLMTRMCLQVAFYALVCSHSAVAGEPPAPPGSTWHTYSNRKYGYTIQYPEGYELFPTGCQGEDDGRTVRIVVRETSALANLLDVRVYPRVPLVADSPLNDSTTITRVRDLRLNGRPARIREIRWREDEGLVHADLYCDGVRFSYCGGRNVNDFQGTTWWQIVSTFARLREE